MAIAFGFELLISIVSDILLDQAQKQGVIEKFSKMILRYDKDAKFLTLNSKELKTKYHNEPLYTFTINDKSIILPQSVLFNNTVNCIPIKDFNFTLDNVRSQFRISKKIETKADQLIELLIKILGKTFYDSETLRLNDIKVISNKVCLTVSKSKYQYYLGTNYSLDACLKNWSCSLREELHTGSLLCKLNKSILANHLGINVLVFTSDNFLVLPKRSGKVNIRKNQFSPSISGVVNYSDFEQTDLPVFLKAISREGKEEIFLQKTQFNENNTYLLGLTRELIRGGKPEVFFVMYINESFANFEKSFKCAKDKDENKSEIKKVDFSKSLMLDPKKVEDRKEYYLKHNADVTNFLKNKKNKISLPLLTNILLWLEFRINEMDKHYH